MKNKKIIKEKKPKKLSFKERYREEKKEIWFEQLSNAIKISLKGNENEE